MTDETADTTALLREALAHHQAGRLEVAENLYRAALAIDAGTGDAYSYLGLIEIARGRNDAAIINLRLALERAPERHANWLSQVETLLEPSRHEEARLAMDRARSHDSNSAAVRPRSPRTSSPAERDALVALFGRGRLNEAQASARRLATRYPDDAFGWKVLGIVLLECGQARDAQVQLERALDLDPKDAAVLNSLGNAFKILGRLDDALDHYTRALRISPRFAEAHNNRGGTLLSLGHLEEALTSLRDAIALKADFAEAHHNLGQVLAEQGRFDEAVASYRQAGLLNPDLAGLQHSLGLAFYRLGRLDEALASLSLAARSEPDQAGVLSDQGNILRELGRFEEARDSYRRALAIDPANALAHTNLGNLLRELGHLDEALEHHAAALRIAPDYAEGYCNAGLVLQDLGRLEEARAHYSQALSINPNLAQAHGNLGNYWQELKRCHEALECYRRALAIEPRFAEAHNNMGLVLLEQGNFDEARERFEQALSIRPDYVDAYLNLGTCHGRVGRYDKALDCFDRALRISPDLATLKPGLVKVHNAFLFILNYHPDKSAEEIYAAYRAFDHAFGEPHRVGWRAHANVRDSRRRLRIGYVSPDFRAHSARGFLEPLLANHDRNEIEVTAYAELTQEDEVTARYRGYVDRWVATRGVSDDVLAERIRADGIDILVDLAGHTANNRLGVFVRRPAPVSVSWMVGYGYTTGLSAIDYFLADEAMVPPGSEGLFAEQPWRLPVPALVYRPAERMGDAGALPARDFGNLSFVTLSRAVRINHRTVRVWSALLQRLPGARLAIDSKDFETKRAQSDMCKRFAAHGIAPERLLIGCHSPPWDLLRHMDIGLDCFPHNSGTTLIESLYMGVPFVTLAGRPSVGRIGSTMLAGAGLGEWIAHSEDEYIEKAVALASDLDRLAALRAGLRTRLEAGPWRDEAGFARRVEAAYREMWRRWCAGVGANSCAPTRPIAFDSGEAIRPDKGA
ncbi:tetratricopeptide repeat protein [Thiocystis violascens]|uniref:protein O-GlcNAc transferase n=1 Tax=Thiocystis violascens (strain ATCC 17096 / DSM 198 / 6111) TaxID=765911 RepID=I3Y7E9_THIV6|nr:tetratricopeptide repeat protein [Thiocystis violascens]AFL72917.1 putative O-linked N-acetylglucosamine transferase, SPINDLY family [Thiocystis violascens DSM 198]